MNKQDKFIKLMEDFRGSSLLKYIGDQELPNGQKMRLYDAKRNHGNLIKNSTYMDSTLKKKGYIRGDDLTGGLSDGLTLDDIAESHGVSYDDIVKQVLKGTEIESEHTSNKSLAKKIAMDHLVEDPHYYDKLENLEESILETKPKNVLFKKIHNYIIDVHKYLIDSNSYFVFSISDGSDTYDSPKIKHNRAKTFYEYILKYINMNMSAKEIIDSLEYHLNESESPCWDGYERTPNTKKYEKGSCRKKNPKKKQVDEKIDKDKMKCNSPRYLKKDERGSSGKKSVVKACKGGKEKIVRFGDANMEIKKDNPKNRKRFRKRHKCDQKKDKFTAGFWSCDAW